MNKPVRYVNIVVDVKRKCVCYIWKSVYNLMLSESEGMVELYIET